MFNRNDPSSVSWGRLLHQTALKVNQQAAEIESLKKTQMSAEDKQNAKEYSQYKRQEKKRAAQLIATSTSSVAELQTIDASVLTPALRESLRYAIQDAELMESPYIPQPIQFDEAALQRFQNWAALHPGRQQAFDSNNAQPFSSQQTSYDRWLANQQKPETIALNQRAIQREMDSIKAQAKNNLSSFKTKSEPASVTDFSSRNSLA